VLNLLMVAGVAGLVTATTALWLQRRRRVDPRFFAGLVATAVTLSLFSVVAWAATVVARFAPLALTWVFVGTLALLFALRLYRELRLPPSKPR
jgi:cobalamin biosynthesis protein CobD/CbiB